MLRFLIFAEFLSSMPNKAKKINFYPIFPIFDLIWHVIQKNHLKLAKWENVTFKRAYLVQ